MIHRVNNVIAVAGVAVLPEKKKPETPEMASPEKYRFLSLRWHYPNQVQGSKVIPSSQPVPQAPRFFNFHHDTPDSAIASGFSKIFRQPRPLRANAAFSTLVQQFNVVF